MKKRILYRLIIVYELTLDIEKPIYCYFAPEIHAAFQTCYDKIVKGSKRRLNSSSTRQCPYCNNFFMKSNKKMKEHISICAGQSGFNFSFDNGKIINYQDNFKKMGDLPFAVYYDFETTTGSVVFLMQRCLWSAIVSLLHFSLILTFLDFLFVEAMIKIGLN